MEGATKTTQKTHVREEKKKHPPICSLLQIAAPLANESPEGCASAIALFRRHYGQRGFKVEAALVGGVGPATCLDGF